MGSFRGCDNVSVTTAIGTWQQSLHRARSSDVRGQAAPSKVDGIFGPWPPLAVITCRSASSKLIPSAPPSRHLKESQVERERHQERAARLKRRLAEAGLPVMPSPSHIVPVMVGDAGLCKAACDELLQRHRIYVQPINYPTVPRGTERLRLTPSPLHSDNDIETLVAALTDVWSQFTLRRAA